MSIELIVMYLGFILAAYSVVGNDVIQTLGTFLTSNEKRPWYLLWAFSASILVAVLIYGWVSNGGDVSFGRLDKIPQPDPLHWWYILPPLVLMVITRLGIPVSTTFLILSVFSSSKIISKMITKSFLGYGVAFGAGLIIYMATSYLFEKKFILEKSDGTDKKGWVAAQWLSTAFLWSQWLQQDLANIFVYLPRDVAFGELIFGLVVLVGLLGYTFYIKGGAIQEIVRSKTNTYDIRSATFVDIVFGIILWIFKDLSNIPMSTTWVFIGLLAGREYAIQFVLNKKIKKRINKMVVSDLLKVFAGMAISVLLVILIRYLSGAEISSLFALIFGS